LKAVRDLKREIGNLKARSAVEPRDVVNIMSKVRTILENDGELRQDCSLVNLFANWCVHGKLTASKVGLKFLLATSRSFLNVEGTEKATKAVHTGMNILDIPKFRQQLISVFSKYLIPDYLVKSKAWWDGFISMLLHEISEKPIQFPENMAYQSGGSKMPQKIFDEIYELPDKYGNKNGKFIGLHVEIHPDVFKICLKNMNDATFQFECHGKETQEKFEY